jgi:uncharacterized protein (DUF2147 family)
MEAPMQVRMVFAAAAVLGSTLLVGPTVATTDRDAFTGFWMNDKGQGATEIKPCGEGLCGYIYSILVLPEPSKPALDNNNTKPELRKRPLCGLQVLGALKRVADNAFGDGWVYDPDTGKQYSVEITLKGNMLAVRGYIGTKLMGKTVEWSRAKSAPPKCAPPKAA